MLDISTSVSEAVEKIPTEIDYRKCSFMCFTLLSHSIQRADQHILYRANSTNSCLSTRIYPVQLKKSQKTFYITLHGKRYNNWHMISFIHCGSEKRVYRFPSGSKLADAREGGG